LFFRVPFSFAFQSQLSVLLMMIVIQRKCCVCVVEILREPSNREPLCEALGLIPVRLLPIALGLEVGARLQRHSSSDVLHQQLSPRISRPLVRSSHKRLATVQLDPIPLLMGSAPLLCCPGCRLRLLPLDSDPCPLLLLPCAPCPLPLACPLLSSPLFLCWRHPYELSFKKRLAACGEEVPV
jgi:hypothetical protein